jgi:hypothetical protein
MSRLEVREVDHDRNLPVAPDEAHLVTGVLDDVRAGEP